MAQPSQYMLEETLPSLFGEGEGVTFRTPKGGGRHESYGDFTKKFEPRLRAVHRWPLSDRERAIVERLGEKTEKE